MFLINMIVCVLSRYFGMLHFVWRGYYACYLFIIGCTWQLHKKAKYDGFKNIYSLENDVKFFTLVSLSPKQVYQDQLKMKKKRKDESS